MTITSVGYDGTVSDVEFAQLMQHSGAQVPLVCGFSDFAVAVNGAATLTCTVAAGSAEAPGVRVTSDATASVVFDAVTVAGQTRWDAVVLRYNWSSGATTLVVVKGTAAAGAPMVNPSGVDLVMDSSLDQVLALVQVTYGSTVPTQVVDRRLRGSKLFTAPSLLALPTASSAFYGMVAELVTGERYKCLRDTSNNPAWIQQGATAITTSGFYSAGDAGWTIDAGSSEYAVDGNEYQYSIVARRSGAALQFGSDSSIADAKILVITGARPRFAVPVQFRYVGGSSSTSSAGLSCFGYLSTAGSLSIESGPANSFIKQVTGVGAVSVSTVVRFTR